MFYYHLAIAAILVQSANSQVITETNWLNHPQIVEIRAFVSTVDQQITRKELAVLEKSVPGDHLCNDRTLASDSQGRPIRLTLSCGSDDSVLFSTFYYDPFGVLRFAFFKGNAVVGSSIEHRIYFDSQGRQIWQSHLIIKGSDYPFSWAWEDNRLPRDPILEFNADN